MFDVKVLTLNALVIVDSVALGTFAVTLEACLLQYIAVQEAYSDIYFTIQSILVHKNDKINLHKDRQEAKMRDITHLFVFHRAKARTSLEITIGALLSQGVNAPSRVLFVLEDETAMTRVAATHHGVTLGSRASSSTERSTWLTHTCVVIVLD